MSLAPGTPAPLVNEPSQPSRRCGVDGPLIAQQIIFYGAAFLAGLVAGALSHSALIAACAAGIVAVAVATALRASG